MNPSHIFLSYASDDNNLVKEFKGHLTSLEKESKIAIYDQNDLLSGGDMENIWESNLMKSSIFLACISANYANDSDAQRVFEMAQNPRFGLRIIPVLFKEYHWEYGSLKNSQPLPTSKKFIYADNGIYKDSLFLEVVKELDEIVSNNQRIAQTFPSSPVSISATVLDPEDGNMLYGRREDYDKLCAAIDKNPIVNIRGIAGIGKTTLVNFFLSQPETEKRFPIRYRIVLSDSRKENADNSTITENDNYRTNDLNTALFLFFADKIPFKDADTAQRRKMIEKFLASHPYKPLLILDNADRKEDIDANFRWLVGLQCRILITSRNHIQTVYEIALAHVSLSHAHKIFAAYYDFPYPADKINALLNNIQCHTLLIEVCAKQLRYNKKHSMDDLIHATSKLDLSILDAKNILLSDKTYIASELHEFLLYLFQPDTLSDDERKLLSAFCLLRNIPYPSDILIRWLTDTDTPDYTANIPDILSTLAEKGWIHAIFDAETPSEKPDYALHPLLTYTLFAHLAPNPNTCRAFLDNIADEGFDTKKEPRIHRIHYLPDLLHLATHWDTPHPSLAKIRMAIGNFYQTIADYPQALEYYLQSLSIHEKVYGKEHPHTADSYNNIGLVYNSLGDYPKALEYYHKDLSICEKVYGKEHPSTATSYNNIGGIYDSLGDYPKALEYHFKSLAIREKVYGIEHPDTATSYNNIGSLYNSLGDYPKALEYYEKALSIYEKIYGKEHPNTTTSYNNIGSVYYHLGDYPKALGYYNKDLSICEKVYGKEHRNTATSYNNIGLVYDNLGDYHKALEYYRQSLSICEKVLGKEHPTTAISYNNIGNVYYKLGDYPKALEYYNKALSIREKVLGKEHPNTVKVQRAIEEVEGIIGDYSAGAEKDMERLAKMEEEEKNKNGSGVSKEEAIDFSLRTLPIYEKIYGKHHLMTAYYYNHIGLQYYHIGDYQQALNYYLQSLPIYEKAYGSHHLTMAYYYTYIGMLYYSIGDFDQTIEYYQKSLSIYEHLYGKDTPIMAYHYSNMGLSYAYIHDYPHALQYYLQSLSIYETTYGNQHESTRTSYRTLADIYTKLGDNAKAAEYYQKANPN